MTQAIKEYQGLQVQQDSVAIDTTVDTVEFHADDFDVTEAVARELSVTQKFVVPLANTIPVIRDEATTYYAIGANTNTTTAPNSFGASTHPPRTYSQGCTIQNLLVASLATSGTGTLTITIMVNGIDTALLKQIDVSTTWNFGINSTDTITVADGDYLTIKMVRGSALIEHAEFYFEVVK